MQHHVQDFQAFRILLARYVVALIPPAASRPEMACLALETMTVRLRTFCMHLAASSLEPIMTSCKSRPAKFDVNINIIIHSTCGKCETLFVSQP